MITAVHVAARAAHDIRQLLEGQACPNSHHDNLALRWLEAVERREAVVWVERLAWLGMPTPGLLLTCVPLVRPPPRLCPSAAPRFIPHDRRQPCRRVLRRHVHRRQPHKRLLDAIVGGVAPGGSDRAERCAVAVQQACNFGRFGHRPSILWTRIDSFCSLDARQARVSQEQGNF